VQRLLLLCGASVVMYKQCTAAATFLAGATGWNILLFCAYLAAQVDLVAQYGRPALGLDYYTAAEDLKQLADLMTQDSSAAGARCC
jgi:hypothetical protein